MFLTIVLDGTLPYEIAESGEFEYGSIIISAIAIFGWFLADAKEHGIDPSPFLRVGVVAVAPITIPYYRFRYMGANRGFLFVAIVIGCIGIVLITAATTLWLIYEVQVA